MSEEAAARCSFHEYELRYKGHERQLQKQFEITRWLAWQMLTPHYKRGMAPKTPKDFFPFAWEKVTQTDAMQSFKRSKVTPEETAMLDKLFSKQKSLNNG